MGFGMALFRKATTNPEAIMFKDKQTMQVHCTNKCTPISWVKLTKEMRLTLLRDPVLETIMMCKRNATNSRDTVFGSGIAF